MSPLFSPSTTTGPSLVGKAFGALGVTTVLFTVGLETVPLGGAAPTCRGMTAQPSCTAFVPSPFTPPAPDHIPEDSPNRWVISSPAAAASSSSSHATGVSAGGGASAALVTVIRGNA